MDLFSKNTIKKVLKYHETQPLKKFGQNFLIDKGVIKKIFEAAELQKSDVVLEIYSTKGERIKQLYRGTLFPDKYRFTWDCIDESGSNVSSGVYYVVLTNDRNGFVSHVKKEMLLLK